MRLLKKSWPLVLCICCGGSAEHSVVPDPPFNPPCDTCQFVQPDPTSQPTIEKQLYVMATPQTLMFYADLNQVLDEQTIHIENHTATSVLIRNTRIVDVPDQAWSYGDSIYFTMANDVSASILEPGEQAEIGINFIGGTKQRTALLRVETSYEQDAVLLVSLQGKLFTGW